MGIIRLTLITAVLIWLAMMYFGRDEGLPETLIGREPAAVAPTPAPEPTRDTARTTPEPAPSPDPEPAPRAAAPDPAPEPAPNRATITTVPLESAVDEAVGEVLATPEPQPDPAPQPATVPEPEPEPEPAPETNPVLYVTGSRVNVRSGPSTVYGVVTSLPRGAAVIDLGDAGEGWRMIRLSTGATGYMSGDFLALDAP